MEREVGGGIGMGNTCKPLAVSFQCMTKSTTNKKKKKSLSENGFSTEVSWGVNSVLGDAFSLWAGLPAPLKISGQREGPTAPFLLEDASCVTGTLRYPHH